MMACAPAEDLVALVARAEKGGFNLTMRLCAPKSDALIGKWNPPRGMKIQK